MRSKRSENKQLITGTFKRHPEGFGFVIPEDNQHPDIYIPSTHINSAFTNDQVTASVQQRRGRSDQFFGAIESIKKRHREFATGPYEILDNQGQIQNHNLSCSEAILIHNPQSISINEKDWLKVKITQYPDRKKLLKGEVIENLGTISYSAKDDVKRVLSEHNISWKFPKEVEEESNQIPDSVREEDCAGREDHRDKSFITIDGETAKDYDDAIYIEKQNSGYRLFVAIADVSHYIKEDSLLDQEASSRGNSTYLPNVCIPMLPEKLSNGICSLNPLEDRLVMVAEIDYNLQGEVIHSRIYPSVIINKKRFTYTEVQNILDGHADFGDFEFLKDAKDLANILMKNHYEQGALNLEIEEINVVVNDLGEPLEFVKESRLFAHELIEQFMLAANKVVSAFLESKKTPLMYRVHENPKEDQLEYLKQFAKTLGYSESFDSRQNILDLLTQFKNHEKTPIINKLILRSLAQARYSSHNKGHYGLNFKSYTHFTSPIRRYCDLTIHRLIKESHLSEGEIEKKAAYISSKEQNSVKAERKIKNIKKARFLSLHLGKHFSGVISSVTSFGIFVALDEFDVEGLVRLKDLPGHWLVDEVNLIIKNKRSGYQIRYGDAVEIQVLSANPITGTVDFQLISHKGSPLPQKKEFIKNSTYDRSSDEDFSNKFKVHGRSRSRSRSDDSEGETRGRKKFAGRSRSRSFKESDDSRDETREKGRKLGPRSSRSSKPRTRTRSDDSRGETRGRKFGSRTRSDDSRGETRGRKFGSRTRSDDSRGETRGRKFGSRTRSDDSRGETRGRKFDSRSSGSSSRTRSYTKSDDSRGETRGRKFGSRTRSDDSRGETRGRKFGSRTRSDDSRGETRGRKFGSRSSGSSSRTSKPGTRTRSYTKSDDSRGETRGRKFGSRSSGSSSRTSKPGTRTRSYTKSDDSRGETRGRKFGSRSSGSSSRTSKPGTRTRSYTKSDDSRSETRGRKFGSRSSGSSSRTSKPGTRSSKPGERKFSSRKSSSSSRTRKPGTRSSSSKPRTRKPSK